MNTATADAGEAGPAGLLRRRSIWPGALVGLTSACASLVCVSHPDSAADAGPGEGVGARHMLRLLCTVCTALSAEPSKDASDARRAELLAAFEDRLRHPEYRGCGGDF